MSLLEPAEPLTFEDEANALAQLRPGVDGIIHLGGLPYEFGWDEMLKANIVGTYNMFEAARRAGVGRIVFASTNQVVGFYPRERRFGIEAPLRPSSRYGVTKAFGESLAIVSLVIPATVMLVGIGALIGGAGSAAPALCTAAAVQPMARINPAARRPIRVTRSVSA